MAGQKRACGRPQRAATALRRLKRTALVLLCALFGLLGVLSLGSGTFAGAALSKGLVEVCKTGDGDGVTGTFTFQVGTKTVQVPAGACSPAIEVDAGQLRITELAEPGITVVEIAAQPAGRLVTTDLPAREATVRVVAGDLSTETVVTFTNRFTTGIVKVCKVAGSGIKEGSRFTFDVAGTALSVPAGPAPDGLCAVAGSFPVASEVAVIEAIGAGFEVTAIDVFPPDRRASPSDVTRGRVTVTVRDGTTNVRFVNRMVTPLATTIPVATTTPATAPPSTAAAATTTTRPAITVPLTPSTTRASPVTSSTVAGPTTTARPAVPTTFPLPTVVPAGPTSTVPSTSGPTTTLARPTTVPASTTTPPATAGPTTSLPAGTTTTVRPVSAVPTTTPVTLTTTVAPATVPVGMTVAPTTLAPPSSVPQVNATTTTAPPATGTTIPGQPPGAVTSTTAPVPVTAAVPTATTTAPPTASPLPSPLPSPNVPTTISSGTTFALVAARGEALSTARLPAPVAASVAVTGVSVLSLLLAATVVVLLGLALLAVERAVPTARRGQHDPADVKRRAQDACRARQALGLGLGLGLPAAPPRSIIFAF